MNGNVKSQFRDGELVKRNMKVNGEWQTRIFPVVGGRLRLAHEENDNLSSEFGGHITDFHNRPLRWLPGRPLLRSLPVSFFTVTTNATSPTCRPDSISQERSVFPSLAMHL